MAGRTKGKPKSRISLAPLSFDEAVSDLLKVGPMPKTPKKTKARRKRKK
jgi:hypothetical protein